MNNDFELRYRWIELVNLATGLHPERRVSPLAQRLTTVRGFEKNLPGKVSLSWKYKSQIRFTLSDFLFSVLFMH